MPKSAFGIADPEVVAGLNMAIATVKALGATVVDDAEFSNWRPNSSVREDLFDNVVLREGYSKHCKTIFGLHG